MSAGAITFIAEILFTMPTYVASNLDTLTTFADYSLLLLVILYTSYRCYCHLVFIVRGLVTNSIRVTGEVGIDTIDSHQFSSEEIASMNKDVRSCRVRRHQLACSIGVECRAKFGFRVRSEANEIIARKWIYDSLVLLVDMRKADIPHIMPYALEVAFTPSIHELRARAVTQSRAVQTRLRDSEIQFWDWGYYFARRPEPLSG